MSVRNTKKKIEEKRWKLLKSNGSERGRRGPGKHEHMTQAHIQILIYPFIIYVTLGKLTSVSLCLPIY